MNRSETEAPGIRPETEALVRDSVRDSKGRGNPGRPLRHALVASVCAAALLIAPVAAAEDAADMSQEGGMGAASAVATLVYGPVKLTYALGGILVSGFAWVFSGGDSEVATVVLTRSVRGTYVVTPEILRGEDRLEFIGREPQYREVAGRDASLAAAERREEKPASTWTDDDSDVGW